ncbi:glycosyltransferase family protein [Roseomonas elaeocarpi]|uniref:Glycosyltransferase subfamily 4-like N-terminal domain-containing protein n=1 Tax=Roseomonas elaeocarpi TaxID=907779 RepID=A0ABV6JMZ6_9PROT
MILVFDMTNGGTAHVPINRGLLQAVALALPGTAVRFYAEADHLDALRADPAMRRLPNLRFAAITLSPLHRWKTHIVSARRFWRELRTIRTALRAATREAGSAEPHLILLASTTPTAILAALIVARTARQSISVQVGMHGNLNEVVGWRSRHPLIRRLDLHAMLARPARRLRLLVFETVIREALESIIPGSLRRTDVLPHPVDTREAAGHPPPLLDGPLRIGIVGMATGSKGIDAFLRTARLFRARHGDRIEFHIVGGRPHTIPAECFADIAHPVEIGHIPRDTFVARLAQLHYVFLPLQPGYYSLSPSGGLMDAVAWCKPVIAARVPITEALFDEGGDIGHLCDDLAGMQAVLEDVLARGPDRARYEAQVAALRRLREGRGPEAQAVAYRTILRRGFPELFRPAGGPVPSPARQHASAPAATRAPGPEGEERAAEEAR